MKARHKLALGVLVGVLMGAAGAKAIRAQQEKTRPGYVVAEVEEVKVTDPAALNEYIAKAPQTVASYGGHFVVRGGAVQTLEGDAPKGAIVILGFDSVEKAHEWYDSPDYKAIRGIRQAATKSRLLLVEGTAVQ